MTSETFGETPAAFDLQPTLRGVRLELRPLRPEDADALYAVASDPLIWAQHPAKDRYQEAVFRAFLDDAFASGGALVAVDLRDGRIVGSSRFHGFDSLGREVEIGWTFLARSHWGGPFNAEMKRLMLRHAFRFVDRVVFRVGPHNHRSQRALENIGAVRLGWQSDGHGQEAVVFEMTPEAFARSPLA